MPRVPTIDSFRTAPTVQPNVRVDAPSGPGAGSIAAEQGQRMAQSVGQAGDMVGRVAMDMQQQVNETRVVDAVNLAKERMFDLQYGKDTGYTNLKGFSALDRPDGQSLPDEYTSKFTQATDEITKGLGNDAQRKAFARVADGMRVQLYGATEAHVSQEFKTYQSSVYDGAAANAKRQIALNYSDVQDGGQVDQGVATIEAAVRAKARMVGMSQEFADVAARKEISDAHRLAIKTAIERSDITFAEGYLNKYRNRMDADDILAVQGAITKEMDLRQGVQAAASAVQMTVPKLIPSDMDRLVNITMQTESNGQRYGKDGQLLTSPKGAKGEMQVLDGTNKDPGFGVKPAKDDSPEERARVGRDYLAAMVTRYGGDPAKAWAAYNGGPGAVDDALMRAKASRGPRADWLTFMPNETQAYVAKNLKALQAGGGAPAAPTLMDVHAQVREQLGPDAKPQVVQAAIQEATRRWEDITKAKTARDDQNVAEAQRMLIANNGRMDALPPSLRTALPPGKYDDVMSFAEKLAKGVPITTDWPLYYSLSSDPQLLKNTNLMALRSKLGESEFKQLTDRQTKLNNPQGDEFTHLQSARDVLNTFMKQAGINPSPKFDDAEGTAKVGTLLSAFQTRVEARERLTGKKLDTAQLNEEAAQLFKPAEVERSLWFNTTKPTGLVGASDRVVVPASDRAQIVASLKKAGRPVTEQAIETLYRAHNRIPQRTAQD